MTDRPAVSVVILNWNGRHFLEKFLPSVVGSSYPNLRIVVGDNASTDDSVAFLEAHYPQVKLVINKANYGFAEGYNRVLSELTADYFVLLNSDVEVTPGWIEPVLACMEADPLIAAAQPLIASQPDKEAFEYAGAAGGFIDKLGYPFCRGRIFDTVEKNKGQYTNELEVFWASGAALFIKAACWRESGGFDPHFFAHMEEIDLCWRLKIKGYRVICCPGSTVYHVGGGTLAAESPYKTYLNFRNNLLMIRKNMPPGPSRKVIVTRFFLDFISLLRFILQGKFKLASAISKAHRHYLTTSAKMNREQDFSRFNASGMYDGSIVWEYFGRKKKTFSSLDLTKFKK